MFIKDVEIKKIIHKALALILVTAGIFVFASRSTAQSNFNEQINYQGKLTDATGATVPDGTYNMRFWLLTSDSIATTSAEWTESLTGSNRVQVTSGLFSVMLGSSSPLTDVDFNQTLYLGVEIGSTTTSPVWDGEMSPRKVLGAVPAAFEARQLGGASSTQYLRSDIANSATALLSFLGGASTTDMVVSGTTTMTTLDIGGEQYTTISDGVGSGLTNVGGVLTANISEANLNITGAPTDGYVLQASSTVAGGFIWQATSSLGINGHDLVTLAGTPDYLTLSGQEITLTQLDLVDDLNTFSSANLANRLTDETGTGGVSVFSAGPTFTGTTIFANASSSNLVVSDTATVTTLYIGGDLVNELAGTGLTVTGNALTADLGVDITAAEIADGDHGSFTYSSGVATIDNNAITPDMASSTGQSDEYCLTYEATGDTWEWQDCAGGSINLGDLANVDDTNASNGTLLVYNGSSWATTSTSSLAINTDDLVEGSNLFYTDTRVASYINSSTTILNAATEAGLEAFLTDVTDVLTNNDTIAPSQLSLAEGNILIGDSGSNAVATSSLFVTTNGNVGVGRTTAGYKLDVLGAGRFTRSDNNHFSQGALTLYRERVDNVDPNANFGVGMTFVLEGDADDSAPAAGGITVSWENNQTNDTTDRDSTMSFYTMRDNTEQFDAMVLTSDGYLGIGTTSPASKLDVWGDFRVGTGSTPILFADASANQLMFGTTTPYNTGGVYFEDTSLYFRNTSSAHVPSMSVDSFGLLELNAPAGSAVIMNTSSGETLRAGGNGVFVNLLGSPSIDFTAAGDTDDYALRVDASSDFVGVGTSTPAFKFSVAGDTYITGALRDNSASAGTNGMVLQTTGSGFQWVATSSLGISGGGATTLAGLSDVDTTGAVGGDILMYNGTSWVDTSTSTFLLESELNTEAELEALLGDVTNVVTTNTDDISSANLATALSDETGSGNVVFSASPTLTGTTNLASLIASGSSTIANLNFTTATGTTLVLGGDTITDFTGTGLVMSGNALTVSSSSLNLTYLGLNDTPGSFTANRIPFTNSGGTAITDTANFVFDGTYLGVGTSSPDALLAMDASSLDGATTAGIHQHFSFGNSVESAIQYGNRTYYDASANTATTTMVGGIIRLEDGTTFGNTVRGFEVQANRGGNTQGENTALSGFARTFGVRGYTSGDAGGSYEPAGGFFETGGTTQGNAIRGYSSSITTAELLSLFHDTSDFTGTGMLMNFGNSGGSFPATSTAKFVDFQQAGTSMFTVTANGTTTIGDGTTNNQAGLQIGYGGLCVDNDGSCNASTTGRISSVSSYTGNSDLAEMYFSSQDLVPGEIVVSDGFLSVTRATGEAGERVLGVVSTKPGLLLGYDDTSLIAGQQGFPLALSGRVPVRLSDENGDIAVGDALTLSSIPGVAMKAADADLIVGYALESFDGENAYTEGFVDQFGDDIAKPHYEAINTNTTEDVKAQDGCFYGGGTATGEEEKVCEDEVEILETMEDMAERLEREAQRRYEAEQRALQALLDEPAETMFVNGESVKVGQVIMFVETGYQLANVQLDVLNELTSTSSDLVLGAEEGGDETLWDRLKTLAQGFVDGTLALVGIKAEKIETNELCVDGVCVDANDLRALLDLAEHGIGTGTTTSPVETNTNGEEENGVNENNVENTGENQDDETSESGDNTETGTSTEPVATSTPPTVLDQGTSTEETTTETETSDSVEEEVSETGVSEGETTDAETTSDTTEEGGVASVDGNGDTTEDVAEDDEPEPDISDVKPVVEEEPEPKPEPVPAEEPEPESASTE